MPGPQPRYWGPFAALVWIVTRDEEATARARQLEATQRPAVANAGQFLATRSREPGLAEWLELDPEGDDGSVQLALWRFVDPSVRGPAKDIETALPALLQQLRDGRRLLATGHRNSEEERISIPVHFWHSAKVHLADPGRDEQMAFWNGHGVWTEVLMPMHDVKRCWQRLNRGKRTPRRPTDKAVDAWYKERVATWPPDEVSPSLKDDFAAAKREMERPPSRDRVALARQLFAPAAWKKGGRPIRKTPE